MAVLLFIMRSALGTPAPAFQPTAGAILPVEIVDCFWRWQVWIGSKSG